MYSHGQAVCWACSSCVTNRAACAGALNEHCCVGDVGAMPTGIGHHLRGPGNWRLTRAAANLNHPPVCSLRDDKVLIRYVQRDCSTEAATEICLSTMGMHSHHGHKHGVGNCKDEQRFQLLMHYAATIWPWWQYTALSLRKLDRPEKCSWRGSSMGRLSPRYFP